MKKIYFLIVLTTMIFVTNNVKSQIDIVDGITYQAVVVDENGKEIAGMDINGIIAPDKAVNVRFTILKGSVSGNIEYQETQIVNTDATGLFSCVIGHGQTTSASLYSSILRVDWGNFKHFLKVEIDIKGADDFKLTGVEQMMAVPYAFWALGYHEKDSIKWSGPFDKYGDIGRWGNVGIGDTIPTQKLDVNGQIRMRGGVPSNTKLLISASDGTASWDSIRNIATSGNGLTWNGNTINSVWTQSGNDIFNNNLGNVGIGTASPIVSVHINTTDAIAIPSGTTAQQPVSAPVGSMRFNTTMGAVEVFNGTCWQNINTPPIGSTYIQWFGATDPNTIYPCTQWISSDIANGEFIRAIGGLSNVGTPPLTGIVQNFATEDHTHSSSGSVGNSSTLTTSLDGSHNHGGTTGGVSSYNPQYWIPYDDNTGGDNISGGASFSDMTNSGDFCGTTSYNGSHAVGNFLGQMGDACFSHTHGINSVGDHSHTIVPHDHPLTLSVGNMSSGISSTETRPSNVAVIFWRRIL